VCENPNRSAASASASLVAPDEGVPLDVGRVWEEHRESRERVRVRLAHEAVPQYADS